MALIKCPECGKENVSNSAEACPNCGYGIKVYFEKIEEEKQKSNDNNENPELKKSFLVKGGVIVVAIFLVLCGYVFYQESKCKWLKCNEMSVKDGRYCEKHRCTTEGCLGGKDAWSNVCVTCHEENMKKLEEDDIVQKLHNELVDKYGEDVFSEGFNMPDCSMGGCDEEGSSTYGGKWYCSRHLYEMKSYGDIISN